MQKPNIRKKIKAFLFYKYKKKCLKIKMLEDTLENVALWQLPNNVKTPENSAFGKQRYDPAEVTLFDGSLNTTIWELSDQSLKNVMQHSVATEQKGWHEL